MIKFYILLILVSSNLKAEILKLLINPKFLIKLEQDIKNLNGRKYRFSDELVNYKGKIIYKDQILDVNLDIHGDLDSHWRSEQKSFSLKFKNNLTFKNMQNIHLIRAKDKYEELEVIGQKLSKSFGLFYRNIELINVSINNSKSYKYILYEKMIPDALEHNGLSGAFIISNNNAWKTSINTPTSIIQNSFMNKDTKDKESSWHSVLFKIRPKNYHYSVLERWENFISNLSPVYYDPIEVGHYLTIVSIIGSTHSVLIDNLRWLYKPWSGKFSPIYYDSLPRKLNLSFKAFLNEISRLNLQLSKILKQKPDSYWLALIKKDLDFIKDQNDIMNNPIISTNIKQIDKW